MHFHRVYFSRDSVLVDLMRYGYDWKSHAMFKLVNECMQV